MFSEVTQRQRHRAPRGPATGFARATVSPLCALLGDRRF
jgi:hypothetical protein